MSAQPVETTWKNLSKIRHLHQTRLKTVAPVQHSTRVSEQTKRQSTTTLAWLQLITLVREIETGDEWLPLCDDIDQGELYQDWFLWYDADVTQEWEAYDPLTDDRLVAPNKETILAQIDKIEKARRESGFHLG